MHAKAILASVPEVYHGFLPGFFREAVVPPETAATCGTCSMWPEENAYSVGIAFTRETKCCTHYPEIPNYQVGALLANEDAALAEGRKRMRELIAERATPRPHGIIRTAKWELLLKNSSGFFGRSTHLVCLLFDRQAGICTVRPFWDAVCSSWFCKFTAGQTGRDFWTAYRRYFVHLQRELARHVLFTLGFNSAVILNEQERKGVLTPESVDDRAPDAGTYRTLWGEWEGREETFYREAHSLIAALSPEEFERIAGATERVLRRKLSERYFALISTTVPIFLRRNPELKVVGADGDGFVVIAYSPYDPLQISERLYRVLDRFDGKRNTEEVLRALRDRGDAAPSGDTLLMLYRFRLLVPVEAHAHSV